MERPTGQSSGTGCGPFQAHVLQGRIVGCPAPVSNVVDMDTNARRSPAKTTTTRGTTTTTTTNAIGGNLAELQDLLKAAKLKEQQVRRRTQAIRHVLLQLFPSQVKFFVRDSDWPPSNLIRSHLWLEMCRHRAAVDGGRPSGCSSTNIDGSSSAVAAALGTGFYAETVDQVFGRNHVVLTVMRSRTLGQCFKEIGERSEDSVHLPSFVDQSYMLTYALTDKGCSAARRVICVIGYTHPDITYCPELYPLTSLFLHYMNEEDTYNAICVLVKSRQGKYLQQTKVAYEASWRTVHSLAKKHAKAALAHLGKFVKNSYQVERLFEDWFWWIFKHLPFTHLVRIVDCFLYEGKKVLYRVAIALVQLFAKHTAKMDASLSQDAVKHGLRHALQKFCEELPVTPGKLLKVAFGIRSLSQKNINNIQLRLEMSMKSKALISGPVPVTRSFSTEGMPTSQSQINIHTTSHTLNIRELFTLWSWLPTRITMYQPELIYTTEEHGCSLLTFYSRVQDYEPTLLIIKTTNDEIFGAYCSTKWAEKNTKGEAGQKRTYFGTGETFLFTVHPEMKRYRWVALHNDGGTAPSSASKHSSELFMAADAHMITVGGGSGQAIWIDENVRFGGTSRCDTFDNPPLCDSENFECRVVEVIGFK